MKNDHFCLVAPSPEVYESIRNELKSIDERTAGMSDSARLQLINEELGLPIGPAAQTPRRPGFNDGVFYPDLEGSSELVGQELVGKKGRPTTTGSRHVLVILVDFPNKKGTETKAHFEKLLFKGDHDKLSMRKYYQLASIGQLDVTGEIFGWYTLPHEVEYYTNGKSAVDSAYPHNGQKLIEDALDAAIKAGIDFSKFDADKDKHLDGFIVIHAGAGAEAEPDPRIRANLIWSHKWNITQPRTQNGVVVSPYTLQPEDGRVGVFSHEFGHFLGLPDLYDASYRSAGVGDWCLMGGGSWGGGGHQPTSLSAWCRLQLGWLKATEPTGGHQCVEPRIEPSEHTHGATHDAKHHEAHAAKADTADSAGSNGSIIRLSVPERRDEYFLLECRQKEGLDTMLPGEGLFIWHIDDAMTDNTNPQHYWVGLVGADGKQTLEFNGRSDAGQPYPGTSNNTAFTDTSNPNSRTFPPVVSSGISVTNIRLEDFRTHAGGKPVTQQAVVDISLAGKGHKKPHGDK